MNTRHPATKSIPLLAVLALAAGCGDRDEDSVAEDVAVLHGELAYLARVALPTEAWAVVTVRFGDAGGPTHERRWPLRGAQVPVPFSLDLPAAAAGPGASLRGVVYVEGRAAWVSPWMPVTPTAGSAREVGRVEMAQAPAGAFNALLVCGGDRVSVGFEPDGLRLAAEGVTERLRRVEAASGARFQGVTDAGTTLWNRGELTSVALRGRALPACATRPADGVPRRARGNEPSWSLEVGDAAVTFGTPDGAPVVTDGYVLVVRADGVGTVTGGDAPVVEASFRAGICTDSMSGMPFPATATVRVGGVAYEGCAGEPVDLLLGPPWIVAELDGEPVTEGSVPTTIAFGADGTAAGDTGCNGYTGAYALSGEGLTVSRLASTLRACPPPAMEHEAAFLELLASVSRFGITGDGALRLVAWDGRTVLARR